MGRYLKGIFNESIPVSKYNTIWPVENVLLFLEALWPLEKITLKNLTVNLVMLIVLTYHGPKMPDVEMLGHFTWQYPAS